MTSLFNNYFISSKCNFCYLMMFIVKLTHWGRVTHICVGKLSNIGSDNGLSPGRRQAIIWTNACILLIRPLGTNFSEILVEILAFSFMKMRFKVSSAKWRPFCLGLNLLTYFSARASVATMLISYAMSPRGDNIIWGSHIVQPMAITKTFRYRWVSGSYCIIGCFNSLAPWSFLWNFIYK